MRLLVALVCVVGCSSSSESRTLLVVPDGGELDAAGSGGTGGTGALPGYPWQGEAGLGQPCANDSDCTDLIGMTGGSNPACLTYDAMRFCAFRCTGIDGTEACRTLGGECTELPGSTARMCFPLPPGADR